MVGAGLSGSLAALFLAKRGYSVDIFEQRPDIRLHHYEGGRSINLAMSYRGLKALQAVGMGDILDHGIGMKGRMIHDRQGQLFFQPYGKRPTDRLWSYSRGELNRRLLAECVHYPQLQFHFEQKAVSLDVQAKKVGFQNTKGQVQTHSYQTLIGTDGSASIIRKDFFAHLGEKTRPSGGPEYDEQDLFYGYKELTIPPGPHGTFQMEKEALHIWPRGQFMLIALPNFDGSFTCTLFLPKNKGFFPAVGPNFEDLQNPQEPQAVENFFRQEFPDAFPLIPHLTQDFFSNPTGHLGTVKCYPWSYKDEILFFGDASHAIVPFYGQGMNACFEDCSFLDQILAKSDQSLAGVFAEFQERRKRETDAIAQMALENFIEMRDKTADKNFHLYKRLEQRLMKLFPTEFHSQYFLVTFTDTPYSYAMRIGKFHEGLLQNFLMTMRIATITLEEIDQIPPERLRPLVDQLQEWLQRNFPPEFLQKLAGL